MTKQKLTMNAEKRPAVEDADGLLTEYGMRVAQRYASSWVSSNARDLDIERTYPELAGLWYDIRADSALAREHAIPMPGSAPLSKSLFVIPLAE